MTQSVRFDGIRSLRSVSSLPTLWSESCLRCFIVFLNGLIHLFFELQCSVAIANLFMLLIIRLCCRNRLILDL